MNPTSEPAFVPSEQARHTDSVDAPTDDDNAYLPFAQFVQTEAPVAFAYLPATQSMHVAMEVAPKVAEALPVPQSVQAEAPVAFAYLPATQSMQVAIEVAPEVAEALPIPHKLHELMPIVS